MQVSTDVDGARAYPLAAGGTLAGVDPRVSVDEVVKGVTPRSFTITNLPTAYTGQYFAKVTAKNPVGASAVGRVAPFSSQPATVVPGAPVGVTTSQVSESSIAVQWLPPLSNGGDAVTRYRVQWATCPGFDCALDSRTLMDHAYTGAGPFAFTITGLSSAQQYYVRVLANNVVGYGEPGEATALREAHAEVQTVTVTDTSLGSASSGSLFRLSFSFAAGALPALVTTPVAFDAADQDVQAALQGLPGVRAVSVVRADSSFSALDGTAGGSALKIAWRVTFLDMVAPRDIAPLSVDVDATRTTEIQELDVVSGVGAAPTAGSFRVSVSGAEAPLCISVTNVAVNLVTALASLGLTATVSAASPITSPGTGNRYSVTFVAGNHDVDPIVATSVGTGGCTPFATGGYWAVVTRTVRPGSATGANGLQGSLAGAATPIVYTTQANGDSALVLPWVTPNVRAGPILHV